VVVTKTASPLTATEVADQPSRSYSHITSPERRSKAWSVLLKNGGLEVAVTTYTVSPATAGDDLINRSSR